MASKFKLSVILEAVDKITKPIKAVGHAVSKLTPKIKRVGKSLKNLSSAWSGAFTRMGLSVGALWATTSALIIKFTSLGDNIAKTADKLGVSTDILQKWRFVAERSGVAQSTFDMSLQRFTRRLGEAKKGQGELVKGLVHLRIHLKNTDGSYKTSEQVFLEYMSRLDEVEDNATKLMLATKAFDSEGAKMVNMAKGGAKAINALGKELEDMGGVVSEETLRNSEKFGDMMTNIIASIRGLTFQAIGSFLPSIIKKMEVLVVWVKANKAKIVSFIKTGIDILKQIATGFWEALLGIIAGIKKFFKPIAKWLGITEGLNDKTSKWVKIGKLMAKVMASIIGLKFVAFISSLISPFIFLAYAVGLLTAALWANPIVLMIGSITVLIGLIAAVSTNFMGMRDRFLRGWEKITKWFKGLKDSALRIGKDFVIWIWDGIKAAWTKMAKWVKSGWSDMFRHVGVERQSAHDMPVSPARALTSGLAGGYPGAGGNTFQGLLRVNFTNAPMGTSIYEEYSGDADMDVEAGFSLPGN